MDITSKAAQATAGTEPQKGTAAAAGEQASEDFDTFLQLLTAQIRNQDPLQPMDSTQFVEQLATFSSLEQQVRTNDHLESISLMLGELYSSSAGDWVGQQGQVKTSWLPYSGGTVDFSADIPAGADTALMVIRDASGETIASKKLDQASAPWQWDGKTKTGDNAAEGLYNMVIELYKGGEAVGAVEPNIISKVTTASVENGEIVLGFENNITQKAGDVTRVTTE